jgi:hypothetical protein
MIVSKLTRYRIEARRSRKNVAEIFSFYWAAYGGHHAILISPYFLFSICFSLLCMGVWTMPLWWSLPISVLPNLIAFTLGGYALFIAFGNSNFQELMAGSNTKKSPYIIVSATFTHFFIVQTVALATAIVASSRPYSFIFLFIDIRSIPEFVLYFLLFVKYACYFIAFTLFSYAVASIIAIAMALLRVVRWFDTFVTIRNRKKSTKPPTSDND